MQSPSPPSFLKFTTPKHFLVRTVLSLTQRSTCILPELVEGTPLLWFYTQVKNNHHQNVKQPYTAEIWWNMIQHCTVTQTMLSLCWLILELQKEFLFFFCCLTIFATRSCMGWGSRVVLVSGTFSSTGNQRPTAQKKMVAQMGKSQYVVFLWFRGWLSIRKTWYFFVAHVEMPLLFFRT